MRRVHLFAMMIFVVAMLAACQQEPGPTPTAELEAPVAAEEATAVPPTEEPEPAEEPEPTTEPQPSEDPTEEPTTEEPMEEMALGLEPVGCETFGIDAAIAGALQCGYVTVPENRASDGDATIRLAVARVPTDAATPDAPVFQGTGGPGSSGFAGATAGTLGERAEILADRDWIFFSQRGTEFSEPFLNCPDYNNAPFEGAINGWTAEELLAYRNNAFQACVDDFRAQGVDLSAYNSSENAADIDAIRQALGYDQIIYYGESYGTQLGQFLMRSHPEILQAVILDGVVPVEYERTTDVTDLPGAFERVFAGCAADLACSSAYPDPRAEFAAAIDAIRANPPTLPVTLGDETVELEVDSTLAMNAMFVNLYLPRGYAQVPAQVHALAAGDYSPLQNTIPLYFTASNNARVQHYAINCSDDPLGSLDELDLDGLAEHYQELILDDAQALANLCPILDLPQLDSVSDEPITADIPVLLLQGGYDPATPVEGGNLVGASLPNSTNAVFPAGTHIQSGDACALAIMDAFMTDPTTTPDTSCIDPMVTFVVPLQAQINSADGERSMSVELSPGYMLADPQGPLQVFINQNRTTKQFFAAIWDAGEHANAQAALDFMVDEILGITLEERETFAGDAVAGYPTQRLRGALVDPNGLRAGVDGVAFEDEDGRIYSMLFATLIPADVEAVREIEIPASLESITLGDGG